MFCPNCGKADQTETTYCRNCGKYLPDLSGDKKKKATPAEQFKLTMTFNIMSAMAALSMSLMLYVFHLGNPNTHPSVYVAAGLLTAISAWQIVSYFNNRSLKNRFIRETEESEKCVEPFTKKFQKAETKRSLNEADYTNDVPASVTEFTTKNLKEKVKRSS